MSAYYITLRGILVHVGHSISAQGLHLTDFYVESTALTSNHFSTLNYIFLKNCIEIGWWVT